MTRVARLDNLSRLLVCEKARLVPPASLRNSLLGLLVDLGPTVPLLCHCTRRRCAGAIVRDCGGAIRACPVGDSRARSSQSARESIVDARPEHEVRTVRALLDHLAKPVNLGQQASLARAESDLGH